MSGLDITANQQAVAERAREKERRRLAESFTRAEVAEWLKGKAAAARRWGAEQDGEDAESLAHRLNCEVMAHAYECAAEGALWDKVKTP